MSNPSDMVGADVVLNGRKIGIITGFNPERARYDLAAYGNLEIDLSGVRFEEGSGFLSMLVSLGANLTDPEQDEVEDPDFCTFCGEFRLHPIHTYNRDPFYHRWKQP